MKKIKDILYRVSLVSISGDREQEITGITSDSRNVKKGFLFVAIKGLTSDGHDYIDHAIELGASGIVSEIKCKEAQERDITFIRTNHSAKALGIMASNFYGRPSEKLKIIGITGTNGKTTIATLLYELFLNLGYSTGLISTIENRINDHAVSTHYTTPDALTLHRLFHEMVERGCTHCFMEVSSHALDQHRVSGICFTGAVFSNISHDHLDYHHTFEHYIGAKKMLFDELPSHAFALVNVDDRRGAVMLQNTKASKHSLALKSVADFKAKIIHNTLHGLEMNFDGTDVWFKMIGEFNAYNLLATYGVALLLGEDKGTVLSGLSVINGVSGRFEKVGNGANVLAIVDYAHTPQALEKVLETIASLRTGNELLVTVVGCGGDRDKVKRPEMAVIASRLSNKVILTSDNPRTENPEKILAEMRNGIPKSEDRNVMVISDRKEAIRTACNLVHEGDIVLVAGKGHETYQEVDGIRHHFNDKETLGEMLNPQ